MPSRSRSPNACTTSAATSTIRRSFRGSGGVSTEIDSAGGALFYLAIPPAIYATVIEQLGAAGLSHRRSPEQWRRVIVEKPFGTDLATARELNQHRAPALQRGPGLSHRSLSREGNRPEPDGVPVRQRHVRADLESPLHRSRADHRGGNRRRRAARELLRRRRRASRHGAEPPDAAAVARRDGAADRVHRRERARSQDGRAAVGAAAGRRRRARPMWFARSTRPDGSPARRCRAIGRSRA